MVSKIFHLYKINELIVLTTKQWQTIKVKAAHMYSHSSTNIYFLVLIIFSAFKTNLIFKTHFLVLFYFYHAYETIKKSFTVWQHHWLTSAATYSAKSLATNELISKQSDE